MFYREAEPVAQLLAEDGWRPGERGDDAYLKLVLSSRAGRDGKEGRRDGDAGKSPSHLLMSSNAPVVRPARELPSTRPDQVPALRTLKLKRWLCEARTGVGFEFTLAAKMP